MKIKKIITSILLLFFSISYTSSTFAQNNMTLYEFLNTTDEIKASYKYPSMKLADTSNTNGKSLLKAHTPIIIKCAETITTKNIVSGGEVKFVIPSNITSPDGKILISAGTPVTAQISFAQDKGFVGKSGELTVTDFHTTAVDGTYIPLSGSISARPDDKMTVSIILSVLVCPLFLLMKGNEAQLTIGTAKTAYTVTDVYINTTRL